MDVSQPELAGSTVSYINFEDLEEYSYFVLTDPTYRIRLVELLPGNFSDDIRGRIHHSVLVPPDSEDDGRFSLSELQKTIPEGWQVYQTIDGRFLFRYVEEAGWLNSWDHPDPDVDRSKYQVPDICSHGKPAYEALPYVWGAPDNCQHIAVESGLAPEEAPGPSVSKKWTKLPVRANLMVAFRHLRQLGGSRTLWIDAICINQADNDEKGIQIQRMPNIYTLARRVVVWLGPEGNDSQLALHTLQYLSREFEGTLDGHRFCSPDFGEPGWFHRDHELPYDEPTWTSIYRLLQRAWFTRLWTVQEAALANRMATVQCGMDIILLSELRRAVQCLSGSHKLPSPAFSKLLIESMNMLGIRPGNILDEILMNTRHRGCLEPKDRIYAVLGIVPTQFASKLRVCYDDSLSTGRLYKVTFLLHVSSTRRLGLFKHRDVVDRVIDEPSWVPDLSARRLHSAYLVPQFCAGYSSAHVVYDESRQLHASGVQAATVIHVSDRLPDDWNALCIYVHQRLIEREAAASVTEEPVLDAYALALTSGRVEERSPDFGFSSLRDWVKEVEQGTRSEQRPKFPSLVEAALMNCKWRRLIETCEGHVGIAPDDTRPGEPLNLCPSYSGISIFFFSILLTPPISVTALWSSSEVQVPSLYAPGKETWE